MIYADTSFLVPLYLDQSQSRIVSARAAALNHPFYFTPLHRVELQNAIRLGVFRREIAPSIRDEALALAAQDERDHTLTATILAWNSVFQWADELIENYGEQFGNRSLDVLHVAAAHSLGAKLFLTFDERQKKLAVASGLKTG